MLLSPEKKNKEVNEVTIFKRISHLHIEAELQHMIFLYKYILIWI